ncbi:EAL and HDOD domain-containing protein [Alteromonas lipolytica]|uniref:Diguanylate phosphodiesterase n=1 Tax=Alteromonas lipolytica TaxID=1856405 RepID=A0A1E8FKK6_9ALTE|nr:EAL domain-containing protein [Alteromonas lipolytica]OFI36148.1 diguanylate phosphodiesterase [Alteromonas lipolytica]GGF86074.1 histidine kinase [Alteromonas lipolytica]
MFAYVARQPIVDTKQQLYAYELLFRDGEKNCFPDISPDEATSRILAASHLNIGLEAVTGDALAFINFHTDTLLHRFPTSLNPASVVIEITETVDVSDELIEACQHIKANGYRLALDDYDLEDKWQALLPIISIVKFDITTVTDEQIRHTLPQLKAHNIALVAERIETQEQFDYYRDLGFDYFQGYFFAKPQVIKHRKMSSSATNMLSLLKESAAAELSLANINAILERDVSLSYLLLRFINNPNVNKRNEITSLKHAMTFMGEQEVRKFIALLALANLSDDKPMELLSMSLVRARFCDQILLAVKQSTPQNSGFLTGMLSLLDTLMQQHMRELVDKLPLPAEVSAALCGENNVLRQCLMLVTAFERGQWKTVRTLGTELGLGQKQLHDIYVKSLTWANALQNEVSK